MTQHQSRNGLLGLSLLTAFAGAGAQSLPDAGSILRDTTPRTPLMSPREDSGLRLQQAPAPAASAAGDIRFPVTQLRIRGNTVFSESVLGELVRDSIGGERTLDELEQALAKISRHYRQRGYLVARAFLPPQEIRDGVVDVMVVEGTYGNVRLENLSRVNDRLLQSYLTPERLGPLINEHPLDRALLLIHDLTQAPSVGGVLSPGATPGSSDLTVQVGPVAPVTARVELDNYGTDNTGEYRLGGELQWNDVSGSGDRLTARVITSTRGQDYARIGYTRPVGNDGLWIGAGYAESRYKIGEEFRALDAHGRASVWSVSATYPFLRTRRTNLTGEIAFDHKRLDDRIDLIRSKVDKSANVLALGVSGNYAFDGGATTVYATRLEAGRLRIDSPEARAMDDAGGRTHGSFAKLGFTLAHFHPLGSDTTLVASINGQHADKNLDSVEKMSLGGPFGVRAYGVGVGTGDAGYVATAELRHAVAQTALPGKLTLFGFVDTGAIRASIDPFLAGDNTRRLSGAGIGATLSRPGDYEIRVFYATRLGSPADIDDVDGASRAWLQVSKFF